MSEVKLGPWPRGIDQVSPDTNLAKGTARDIVNADVDVAGNLIRRAGFAMWLEGAGHHSLWSSSQGRAYVVLASKLYEITNSEDVILTELAILPSDLPVSFHEYAGRVFFCNPDYLGEIVDGVARQVGMSDAPIPNVIAGALGGMDAGRYLVAQSYVSATGEEGALSGVRAVTVGAGGGLIFNYADEAPPPPPTGDQWVEGTRLYSDTGMTTPAVVGGEVRRWVTSGGRVLAVTGDPMIAVMFDGVLCPSNGPRSSSRLVSVDSFDVQNVAVSCVVSCASKEFSISTTSRRFEIAETAPGIQLYNASATAYPSPQRTSARVPLTAIALVSNGAGLNVYRDGTLLTPGAASPSAASETIQLGGIYPTQAIIYYRVAIIDAPTAPQLAEVLAEHAAVAELPDKPWMVLYGDSQCVLRIGSGQHGWDQTDCLARRLNVDYNVLSCAVPGAILSAIAAPVVVAQEIGTQAGDDGRRFIGAVTNDLEAGNGAAYAAAMTAAADAFVSADIFNADQIVLVIPPYRYAPFAATTFNAQCDILAAAWASSIYTVVDFRAVITFANGGIGPDGVHLAEHVNGIDAWEAGMRAAL